ncbi:MAG: diguanylate cyclase [Clostridiales Family XIII bacterium]|jgi:diguanylate cyclase (GGDEF)-like protein|nr:diguanylate cyclase [Clostridiales Family XIII bacterium]
MKKINANREFIIIGISIILFLIVSIFSFSSIKQLQGNARVVNYDGIVRGATQKLMKMELQNAYAGGVDEAARDALRARLDSILHALDTGEGAIQGATEEVKEETKNLIALPDVTHSQMVEALIAKWGALKNEIDQVRGGEDPIELYALSEEYFKMANDTVFAAEAYSESQVNQTTRILISVDTIFVLMILGFLFFMLRSRAVRRRADMLGQVAYVDPLTKMENRASCERKINAIKEQPTNEEIAVIMFDMNNLKLANDFLGHQGGDKIIAKFAEVLREVATEYGFIGRYGGDEFLAVFEGENAHKVEEYLDKVNEQITAFNSIQVNEIECISFASGYIVSSLDETGMDGLIYEADRNMYANKREMKKRM